MSHTILVPLDGSTFGEAALPMAITLTKRWPARLHLVTVEEPLIPIPDVDFTDLTTVGRWAQGYLDDVGARVRDQGGIEAEVTVGSGTVRQAIQEVAREIDADLVVMSTHGRGPMTRMWLGSVADSLIRECDVPVFLVRPDEDGSPNFGTDVELGHVLIPLDGSPLAESVLERTFSLSRTWDARCTLLRLVSHPTADISAYLPDTVRTVEWLVRTGKHAAEEYLAAVTARLKELGVEVESRVEVVSQVARGIIDQADELDTDWIAVTSHGHGGLTRVVLGSVADKVVRGATQPVLVVPAKES